MAWRHDRCAAEHRLRIGVGRRPEVGERVTAGDVIASGVTLGTATRLAGARRLGVAPDDMERALRMPVGSEVRAGTVLARTGGRFARALTAPGDGRVVHVTADGDVYFAPVVDQWVVRSTLDGEVTRSDDAGITVEGAAWCLPGVAAYGPDAVGEITLGVEAPLDDLAPSRVDVRLGGRIVIAGARVAAEVITRAHACGVAGLVAGGAPAAGLRLVFGSGVSAAGTSTRDDRPTVLCLTGFGNSALPREVFGLLARLAGSRGAIHTASARMFVFAPADAADGPPDAIRVGRAGGFGAVRAFSNGCAPAGETVLASELRTGALRCEDDLLPTANVRAFAGGR